MVAVLLLAGGGCATDIAGLAPTFTVQGDGDPIALTTHTYCRPSICVDGSPPDNPPTVGRPGAVRVRFSEPGWTLNASFWTPGQRCGREFRVSLTQTDDGDWTLDPAGPAGTYHITLEARGKGDAFATFAWTTPHQGTMPAPQARLLTDVIELTVSDLATTPKLGTLTMTVTAANGKVTTIGPEQVRSREQECTVGRIQFYLGPSEENLGPPPLSYDVRLRLEDSDHRARVRVPDDVSVEDGHPQADLTFDPPLAAYTG